MDLGRIAGPAPSSFRFGVRRPGPAEDWREPKADPADRRVRNAMDLGRIAGPAPSSFRFGVRRPGPAEDWREPKADPADGRVRNAMDLGRIADPPHLHPAPAGPLRDGIGRLAEPAPSSFRSGGSATRWHRAGSRNPPHLHSAPAGPLRDGIGPLAGPAPPSSRSGGSAMRWISDASRDPPHLRRPGSVVRTGSAARRTRHSPETVDQLLHRPDVRSAERVVES